RPEAAPSRNCRRGKPDPEYQTGRVIEQLDARAVQTGDGCDKAEPQAVTRRVSALLEAIEALEHLLVLVGRDSRPVVGDRDHGGPANGFTGNDDAACGTAVLERIVDHIGHRV